MIMGDRGDMNSDVKHSVCFVLKFALPPFSPPLPSGVQISKQNTHRTFDIRNTLSLVYKGQREIGIVVAPKFYPKIS